MAEFKDASLWKKLAFLFIVVAHTLELHGFSSGVLAGYNSVRIATIIGFLCLLVAFGLALCYVFLDELSDSKPTLICFIIFSWIAAFALIIGVAFLAIDNTSTYNETYTYPSMLLCVGGILSGIAGVFGILEIVGVKA